MFTNETDLSLPHKPPQDHEIELQPPGHLYFYQDVILLLVFDKLSLSGSSWHFWIHQGFGRNLV